MEIVRQSSFEINGNVVIIHCITPTEIYYEKRKVANSGKEWPVENESWPLFRMPIRAFISAI